MEQDIVELNHIAWNRIADRYANSGYAKLTPSFEYFCNQLIPNCRVLDVGSGFGVPFAKFLVERNFFVIGIDISSRMVQIARQNIPNAEFWELSMTEMKFKSEFGGVVASYSMLLLDPPRFKDVAKRIVHSLQNHGTFYLSLNEPSEPEEESESETFVNIMGEMMYSRGYTEKEIYDIFVPLGLTVLHVQRSIKTSPEFGIEHMIELIFRKKD